MRLAICAAGLAVAMLAANAALAGPPRAARPTLGQFIGLSNSSSSQRCGGQSQCCATPVCQPAACKPKCCPAPTCEPKCCPAPACPPACGCESHAGCSSCCPVQCRPCCPKQYPLEKLLSRMDGALFGKKKCCEQRDPCGYDLWPCVGQCCQPGAVHAYPQPPAPFDPADLRPRGEAPTDPFLDDPEQPPRPPMSPTEVRVRGARLQPAVQRHGR